MRVLQCLPDVGIFASEDVPAQEGTGRVVREEVVQRLVGLPALQARGAELLTYAVPVGTQEHGVAGAEARQLHALPASQAVSVSRPHSAWAVIIEVLGGPEVIYPLLLGMAPQRALC